MVADKSFEKQIQLVMEEHDLQLPEEITLLSDVDLVRTPGIGRVAMRTLLRDMVELGVARASEDGRTRFLVPE